MNRVFELLKVKEAWETLDFDRITKVKIALLDTGCETSHSFFKNIPIECIDGNGIEVEGDEAGNGTFFCGLLLQYLDVEETRKPEILSIKLGKRPRVAIDDICKGIDIAIRRGADVINLGTSNVNYNAKLAGKINEAVEKGIIVISHNEDVIVREYTFPSALDNVVSVASIDHNGKVAYHSNLNNLINICAPGTNLRGPLTKEQAQKFRVELDNDEMATTYGTCYAAAAVCAMAVMAKSIKQDINTYQFMNLLEYSPARKCIVNNYDSYEAKNILNIKCCLDSIKDSSILDKPRTKYYYWNVKYADGFYLQNQWEAELYDGSGKAVEDATGEVEIELFKLNGLRKEIIMSEKFIYENGRLYWKLNYEVPGNYFIKINSDKKNIISTDIAAKALDCSQLVDKYNSGEGSGFRKEYKGSRRLLFAFVNLMVSIGAIIGSHFIKR
ncbi:S8 family peptidase [Clostridium thermarum]|uniref:S8 family peptidase n=1 Tax=Clostridium thermarum TaxID=1716543 RepID=UPI0013D4ADF3|nr:S8 family serine peptidase [Clostridium thermarum]